MKYRLKPEWTIDKVKAQIRKYNDGTRSVDGQKYSDLPVTCRYRSPSGNRCFIGCFLGPDRYEFELYEGLEVKILAESFPELKDLLPFESIEGNQEFQLTHDAHEDEGEGMPLHEYVDVWLDDNAENPRMSIEGLREERDRIKASLERSGETLSRSAKGLLERKLKEVRLELGAAYNRRAKHRD